MNKKIIITGIVCILLFAGVVALVIVRNNGHASDYDSFYDNTLSDDTYVEAESVLISDNVDEESAVKEFAESVGIVGALYYISDPESIPDLGPVFWDGYGSLYVYDDGAGSMTVFVIDDGVPRLWGTIDS